MALRFTYTRLLVDDYGACFRFYRDVLGFRPSFGDETSGYADFDTGEVSIALFDRREMAEGIGRSDGGADRPQGDRLALIFAVEDVDREAAALQERGAALEAPPTDHADWGIRTAHFRDPDGNLIEINASLAAR
jgi:lactoylglutathione lyase